MNYPDEMSGSSPYGPAGNGMAHPSHPSMGYPASDTSQMAMIGQYAAMQGYREQMQSQTMMSPPHYPNPQGVYRNQQHQQQQQQQQHQLHHHQQQHHQQQQQFMNQQFSSMYGNQNFGAVQNPMMMNSIAAGNPMFGRSSAPQGQGAGSPSVHPPPHPHLRQGSLSQNPQQVADNILQMASSTYSSSQTVQVPLNKGRSAPYHNPRTNYSMPSGSMSGMGLPPGMGNLPSVMAMQQGMNMQTGQTRQVMQPAGSPSRLARNNAQFGYPSSSPHPHQPRTSPISPMLMHSPASQHSNQSVHNNPSPGPHQSPAGGGSIRSPVSPNMPVGGMQSPCGKQPSMMSPSPSQQLRSPNQHIQHMTSPMMNCTPISSPSNPVVHNSMRSPLTQQPQHHSPHPQYYSHIQQNSQPQGHYSPVPHSLSSPLSHTSSPPYMPGGARTSPPLSSPHSSVSKPSPSGSTGSTSCVNQPPSGGHQKPAAAQFNPLQSLQKLVMLPETQVVDPKSVVNDACLSSPSQEPGHEEPPKNCDISTDPSRGGQLEGKCVDGKHCEEVKSVHDTTPAHSISSGQSCPDNKSDQPQTCYNPSESVNKPSEQLLLCNDKYEQPKETRTNVTVPAQRTGVNIPREQSSQNNHVQEKPVTAVKSFTDRKQGITTKEGQKSKQENMSPKKRFLGSQPLINGGPSRCEKVSKSNLSMEVTSNGSEKSAVETVNDKIHPKISYSPVCSQKPIEKKITDQDSNGLVDTEGYVNKKFFKKRRMAENHPVSVGLVSCGNSGVRSSPVSQTVTSVIQAPPRYGMPVYDDVSDASDLEEELSVRKDSTVTYTRENRDFLNMLSSPLLQNVSCPSYPSNNSDSESIDTDSVSKPFKDFQDKVFPSNSEEASVEDRSDVMKKSNKSEEVQKSVSIANHNHQSSPKSPSSRTTDGLRLGDNQDEPDAIVSPDKLRPKRKVEPKVKDDIKSKVNSLKEETPRIMKKPRTAEVAIEDSVNPENNMWSVSEKTSKDKEESSEKPASRDQDAFPEPLSNSPDKTTKSVNFSEGSKSIKSDSKVSSKQLDSQETGKSSNKGDEGSQGSSVKKSLRNDVFSKDSGAVTKNSLGSSSGDNASVTTGVKTPCQSISESDTPKKRGLRKWKTSLAKDKVESEPVSPISEIRSEPASRLSEAKEAVDPDSANVSLATDVDSTPGSSRKSLNTSDQPFQKRRGRPPGSKNKVKKEKKHSKRKRDIYEYNSDEDKKSGKSSKKSLIMPPPAGRSVGGKKAAGRPGKKDLPTGGVSSGPFIRVVGSKRKPTKCVIMNAAQDESETKPVKNKKLSQPSSTPSASMSIQLSNLPSDKSVLVPGMSPSDETLWYCCICRKHSSYKFLGDLFGPYYPKGYQPAPSTAEDGSEKPKQRRKKMFVLADQVPNYAALMKPVKGKKLAGEKKLSLSPSFELASGAIADSDELWVHEDCVLWSDGVYLIENNIYGLQEAANVAATAACSCCKEVGASIGCLHKGCSQKYHYVCAVETECYLDEENFSLLCLKHKDKRTKTTTEQSSRKVS
ncbi:uncharacterized protein LOC135468974 isoform X2 [Liolophura sinensis]